MRSRLLARWTGIAAPTALVMSLLTGMPAHSESAASQRPVSPQVRSIPIEQTDADSAESAVESPGARVDDGVVVSKAVGLGGANLVGVTWSSAARPPVVSVRARTDNGWGEWTREVTLQGRYVRFGPLSLHDWQRVRLAIGVLRGEGSWSRVMRQ